MAQVVSGPGDFPARGKSGFVWCCCCRWLALLGWVLEWCQQGLLKGAGVSSPGHSWLHSRHTGGAVAQPRIKWESPRCWYLTTEPLSSPQGALFSCLRVALTNRFKKSSQLPARVAGLGQDLSLFPGMGDSSKGPVEVCLVPLAHMCPPPPSSFAVVLGGILGNHLAAHAGNALCQPSMSPSCS